MRNRYIVVLFSLIILLLICIQCKDRELYAKYTFLYADGYGSNIKDNKVYFNYYKHYVQVENYKDDFEGFINIACHHSDTSSKFQPISSIVFVKKGANHEFQKEREEINWDKINKNTILTVHYDFNEGNASDKGCPPVKSTYILEYKGYIYIEDL